MGVTIGMETDDCPGDGRFPDSSICGAYVDCVPDGNGGYDIIKGDCGGFLYNATSKSCSNDSMVSTFYCLKWVFVVLMNPCIVFHHCLIFIHLAIYSVFSRVTPGVFSQNSIHIRICVKPSLMVFCVQIARLRSCVCRDKPLFVTVLRVTFV